MIRDDLAHAVRRVLAELDLPEPPGGIVLKPPRQRDRGDWATPVALALAKVTRANPLELAERIAGALEAATVPHLARAEPAKPGFVNLYLAPTWLHDVLRTVVADGEGYGTGKELAGAAVNLEFVSANPTGPLHAGGGRWVAVGDAIADLLASQGAEVHREYYLNDTGNQLTTFRDSLFARYRGEAPPEDGYQGAYLVDLANELRAALGDDVAPDDACEWGVRRVIDGIREDLARIGVHFDTWFSERALHERDEVAAVLRELDQRGLVFDADGARWFRSTDFGDSRDRVLVRSDGSTTYLCNDLAYHRDKFARGSNHLIDMWGADHHGQVKSLQAGMEALGFGPPPEPEVLLGQMVKLVRDGVEVRLSKRVGNIVTLADILDEVDPDVARMTFLLQGIDSTQTFDLNVVTSQSMENPVYYVQYAHARVSSIARRAAEAGIERRPVDSVDLSELAHEREEELLRALAMYPDVVVDVNETRAPQKVSTWVRDFARAFHGFYRDCRVITEDEELTQARLWLAEASRIGLANALGLLGVGAPEEMSRLDEAEVDADEATPDLVNDTPFDLTLLPASARVEAGGSLSIGGIDLVGLAAEFGTPLYVYDEGELRARCAEYRARLDGRVAYASKAFLCTAMARLIAEEGLDLDVATGGELHVALHAGFPAERIVFHGNNKSSDELRAALAAGVGRVVIDSFDELGRLERLAGGGVPATVLVRVTPGVEAHTHEYIETGTEDSKFGFGLQNGDALRAVRRVVEGDALRFGGLHCHIGSQVFRNLDSFAAAADRMVGLVHSVESDVGATVDELNLGGGLGVRYVAGDEGPSIAQHATAVQEVVAEALAAHGVRSRPTLVLEPGRSIAGPAGLTLYTVGTVKAIPQLRTYVAVDGGMSDNLRPVTYGARYETFLPGRVGAPRALVATIAGKHCEQGDLLVRDAHLPEDVAVGDVLGIPVTGAYAHSMASNYNKVLRPAVVFVHAGRARLVVRREVPEDLVRLDAP